MIARLFAGAMIRIDARIIQPVCRFWREQQMVDPESGIALPRPCLIIPKRP
jgi:hypothetical protein